MNIKIIIATLRLSTAVLSAQETKEKTTTIRIQKKVSVNGVEKITDTSYTVKGPITIESLEKYNNDEHFELKPAKQKQMVIITDEVDGDNYTLIDQKEIIDDQVKSALMAADINGVKLDVDKILIVNEKDSNATKNSTKIVVIKRMKIEEPSLEDVKTIEKTQGSSDQKLEANLLVFYPNPNNGKFNLNFKLLDKENTEISILNAEGKLVYSEELKDFIGVYNKEIDITTNPKGTYFVKVKQGKHSQLKKLIIN